VTAPGSGWTPISIVAAVVLGGTVSVVVLFVAEGLGAAVPPHSNVRFDGELMRVYAIASGDLLDDAGLLPDDGIVGVNGVEFSTGGDYTAFFRAVKPGDRLEFEVRRGGRQLVLTAVAKSSLDGSRLLIALVPIVVLLLVGGGVFFAGPRSPVALFFLLYCASTAVNDAAQLAVVGGTSWDHQIMAIAYTVFSIQSPALGLHLFVLFPERRTLQKRLSLWLPVAYTVQTALGLSYLLPAFSARAAEALSHPAIHPTLLELFNANVVVCSALSAVSLAATALRGSDDRTRLQARVLFFAIFLLTLAQLAFYTLPLRFSSRMLISAEAYTLLDLIVPLFVAAAVLFYRLFGIDLLVRQGFIYGMASMTVAVFFAALVLGFEWLSRRAGVQWDVAAVALAAAAAGLFFPVVQRWVRGWVDRSLYRRRTSFRQLLEELSGQLGATFDLGATAAVLYNSIQRALQPTLLEVRLYRAPPPTFEAIDPDGHRQPVLKGKEAERAAQRALRREDPFDPRPDAPDGVELEVPLVHGNELLGTVLLGGRSSDVPYLGEDLRFLGTAGRLAAVAFENARLIEERRVNERLATVGSATAAIAHEIKNPLAAIKSTAAILRRRIEGDPRGQELTRVIEEETERLQHSVLDVLTYVRPTSSSAEVFDLRELVEQLLGVVRQDFRASAVEVVFNAEAVPTTMVGHPEQLRQAVLNLLVNAREAMPEGGGIQVALSGWDPGDGEAPGLEVRVHDSGEGFPEEILDRVFEPLVSGKRLGTGLGLANVRRAVEAHGGRVEAGNAASGGAVVTMRLLRGLESRESEQVADEVLPGEIES
jgi:signal transduction histidine kinase